MQEAKTCHTAAKTTQQDKGRVGVGMKPSERIYEIIKELQQKKPSSDFNIICFSAIAQYLDEPKVAEAHLRILENNGVKYLKVGDCDNWDEEKGCLGHLDEQHSKDGGK